MFRLFVKQLKHGMMSYQIKILVCLFAAFVLTCACKGSQQKAASQNEKSNPVVFEEPAAVAYDTLSFEEVQAKYKQLIPVEGGYFITYHKIDSALYCEFLKEKHNEIDSTEMAKTTIVFNSIITNGLILNDISSGIRKWGLIDSTGQILIPFVCDGLERNGNLFTAAIFSNTSELSTGLVRFVYSGKKFQVSVRDKKWRNGKTHNKTITGYLSAYFHDRAIDYGPKYCL
jgi:hypothetical protein